MNEQKTDIHLPKVDVEEVLDKIKVSVADEKKREAESLIRPGSADSSINCEIQGLKWEAKRNTGLKSIIISQGLKRKDMLKKIPVVGSVSKKTYHALRDNSLKESMKRFPIIGPLVWWFYMLFKTPRKIADLNARNEILQAGINEVNAFNRTIISKIDELKTENVRLKESLDDALKKIDKTYDGLYSDLNEKIDKNVEGLLSKITDNSSTLHYNKSKIIEQQQRITALLDELKSGLKREITLEQKESLIKEDDHSLDMLYAYFEDEFRGTREDIKSRVEYYLPYVKEVNAGTKEAPVLDIGCGRGEWLELLKENGYSAIGIDLNRVMIDRCHELGLDAIESDVIEYLKEQKDNSLGMITGFHIVEHLDFKTVIALLDESLRVLKQGGALILESPNPENILVGASYFYIDPTHKNPVHPHTLNFLFRMRGFENVNVHVPGKNPFLDNEAVKDLLGFGSWGTNHPDYAIMGFKRI